MLKSIAIAGLLVSAQIAPAAAPENLADAAAASARSDPSAADYRCFHDAGTGLSGALQIGGPSPASIPEAGAREVEREAGSPNCALV